jgi:hypothetical protein
VKRSVITINTRICFTDFLFYTSISHILADFFFFFIFRREITSQKMKICVIFYAYFTQIDFHFFYRCFFCVFFLLAEKNTLDSHIISVYKKTHFVLTSICGRTKTHYVFAHFLCFIQNDIS